LDEHRTTAAEAVKPLGSLRRRGRENGHQDWLEVTGEIEPELDEVPEADVDEEEPAADEEPLVDDVAPPADDDEPPVAADEVVTRRDCATITIATVRNSATANVTTHLRMVCTRLRRAASRSATKAALSRDDRRGATARVAPRRGTAEASEGVMVTSVQERWGDAQKIAASFR
jgi:hypothetical protein